MIELLFRRHEDAAAAADAAALHIAEHARRRLEDHPVFTLALSGGSTPRPMLERLSEVQLAWDRIHVFQVDERVAPAGDPARNINMVRETLLKPGVLPESNLHPMPVEAEDLERAARDYAAQMMRLAGSPAVLDMLHLGLGDDGHTASLVPGDDVLEARDMVALTAGYRGHRRMTLTFPALGGAAARLWLVSGADKAPWLARLAAGDAGIPAGRVRRESSVVFTDVPPAG